MSEATRVTFPAGWRKPSLSYEELEQRYSDLLFAIQHLDRLGTCFPPTYGVEPRPYGLWEEIYGVLARMAGDKTVVLRGERLGGWHGLLGTGTD